MYGNALQEIRFSQILANECAVSGSPEKVRDELEELRRLESDGKTDFARILLKKSVERLSGGINTILYDRTGLPSVMVVIPAVSGADMPRGICFDGIHPAFRTDKKIIRRVYVSKYINCLVDGTAVSLPMSEPACISCFDDAVRSIRKKGEGWMPMPFLLRMAIVLQCLKNAYRITGNTDCGQDYYHRDEMGIQTKTGTVLTGSGPAAWTHNGRRSGIWDLSGNLNEWDSGFRLMNGEIQLMDISAMMNPECDYGKDSALWYALDGKGKPVPPGSPGTLHYDGHDGGIRLTVQVREPGLWNCAFGDISSEDGLEVPELLRLIGLYPPEKGLPKTLGWRWINTEGETVPLSGGAFRITFHSGMFFMGVTRPRNVNYQLAGVRSVYVAQEDLLEEETGR